MKSTTGRRRGRKKTVEVYVRTHYSQQSVSKPELVPNCSGNCSKSKQCEINHSLSMPSQHTPHTSGATLRTCTWLCTASTGAEGGGQNRWNCTFVEKVVVFFFHQKMERYHKILAQLLHGTTEMSLSHCVVVSTAVIRWREFCLADCDFFFYSL